MAATTTPLYDVLPKFTVPQYVNKRVDLPAEAYVDISTHIDKVSRQSAIDSLTKKFARRPGFNTQGQAIDVGVNQFRVTKMPFDLDVWQFDVSITSVGTRKDNTPLKDIVIKKCWASAVFQAHLARLNYPVIHDGAKLAWATNPTELRVLVDLDVDKGKPAREDKTNEFRVLVKPTKKIPMASLKAYLGGKASWDTSVTECMNFLDHVLRQGPSESFKLIKRSFFNLHSEAKAISTYIEAVKGIYSAIRMNESVSVPGMTGLGINVDVSNQAFWPGSPLDRLILNYIAAQTDLGGGRIANMADLTRAIKNIPKASDHLKRFVRLKFVTTHRPGNKNEEYTIAGFTTTDARASKFKRRGPDGKETEISVQQYYLAEFKRKLAHPDLPLVRTGKGAMFPIELCEIKRLNSYAFKLDGSQTTEMLRFAVQRPPGRKQEILKCVDNLAWGQDKYLKAFGITIDPRMPSVKARLLKNPVLQWAGTKTLDPGMGGRWDLRGCRFAVGNPKPLKAWGIGVLEGSGSDLASIKRWVEVFCRTYRGHGGTIANENPVIMPLKYQGTKASAGESILSLYNTCGNTYKEPPQLMVFVLRAKISQPYEHFKYISDVHFGVPSQMVLGFQVKKASDQYCSNVSMKVNAKLGGMTSRLVVAAGAKKIPGASLMPPNTAMLGVDVSHSAPGIVSASLASMCLSVDKDCAYYLGRAQTNGYREEILTPENIHEMMTPMVKEYIRRNRVAMDHLYYFRDGVSEGQFAQVMDNEVPQIRKVFSSQSLKQPKLTVIVATKRHHIRFFPQKGDKNSNALPGTLVEKEITHPFHYDFYLCSHVAIQGTARPVHYNVLHDEIKQSVDDLQRMIYAQCYQYMRSTTPVSLHPAVYYAHLIGNRARAHDTGEAHKITHGSQGSTVMVGKAPKLGVLGAKAHASTKGVIENVMWYI